MEITKEIIERFFQGDCTSAEADAVSQYLKEHAEIQDAYLSKGEWDSLEVRMPNFPAHLSSEMWHEIKKGTNRQRVISLKRMAAAACFLESLLFLMLS